MIENEAKYIVRDTGRTHLKTAEIFRLCGWEYKRKRTRSVYFDTPDFDLDKNHISLRHKISADGLLSFYGALLLGRGKRHLTLKGESTHDRDSHHASRMEIEPKYKNAWGVQPEEIIAAIGRHADKKNMGQEYQDLVETADRHIGNKKLNAHFGVDNDRRNAKVVQEIILGDETKVRAVFKVSVDEVAVRQVNKYFHNANKITLPLLYIWTFARGQEIDQYRELEIELDKATDANGKKISDEQILHDISMLGAEKILDHVAARAGDKIGFKTNKYTKASRGFRKLKL